MASKNDSASSPVMLRIVSASCGEVSGPVATMTLSQSAGGGGDFAAVDRDQRLGFQRRRNRSGETVAIDGERAAGRQLVAIGCAQHQRIEPAHFGMQKADGAAFGIVGAERIGADQFGELSGLVHGGRAQRAAFRAAPLARRGAQAARRPRNPRARRQ